ncbi:hypothetical protein MPTK1_8g14300 [Marchantia polymorpha subsp. ruderalis]|nr:hypothetical protein MARPO_0108s0057 [Marchantia polymorpha]BBN19860.1 hypothetical protein Mp_8g14300 [Marchantia polymorpha subsp. ruderalis]|eukprot:PTQ31712.1 hypothetical protein MARPO_0108s0057 [Marchantia polymorpha]
MATIWATGVVVPVINGQGLGARAAAGKKQQPKGAKQQVPKSDEQGLLDRLFEWLNKESFSETDALLNKSGDNGKGVSVAPPPQKKGGFFGSN